MYSGTMSVIKSRTTSFVLVDQGKRYGGGQQIWCDPDFVIEVSKAQKIEGKISLPCGKFLAGGKNFMYVSMDIDPLKLADLSTLANVKVQSISVDGKNIDIQPEGNSARYLGSSVRQKGDDGVMGYRIPGLVTTNAGSLIAVYDIRYDSSLDLQNNVDIGSVHGVVERHRKDAKQQNQPEQPAGQIPDQSPDLLHRRVLLSYGLSLYPILNTSANPSCKQSCSQAGLMLYLA